MAVFDHHIALMALRERVLSTVVATTGTTTLTAIGNGFTRSAGSFITDGFGVGMEVIPTGFTHNDPAVIKSVTATELKIFQDRQAEVEGTGRSLTVSIPSIQRWENVKRIETQPGLWYIEEDYIPGPERKVTVPQSHREIEHSPTYVLRLAGLAGVGVNALYTVVREIKSVLYPGLALLLSDGNVLRVGTDPAPYSGQITYMDDTGHAGVAITFPLWARTINPI